MLKKSALIALVLLIPSSASALVLPPDGISLTQIHVQFEWPALASVDSYELWVVEDGGSPDPFAGAPAVVDLSVGPSEPRAVTTSGLAFDKSFAWRVRGVSGTPLAWGPTYRFDITPLPSELPTFIPTTSGGPLQPGLTLFNLNNVGSGGLSYAIGVDAQGDVVWFVAKDAKISDLRLLDSGRILAIVDVATEFTLNGQVAWRTSDSYPADHEVSPMPNGNVLVLVNEFRDITIDDVTKTWNGDRIVEFDRNDNSIVWDWNVFDGGAISLLDYDHDLYDAALGDGFDWTHGNAAIYNPDDDCIYVSFRYINRITRIDYTTKNIVYHMGFDMPSGEVDFGHNLFSWQHSPQMLPNGNMVVYDNGNRRDGIAQTSATGVSKAIELQFTGSPPTSAAIVWEWTLPDFERSRGDADRLANGNTLVLSGNKERIYEVDASGTELWRLDVVMGAEQFSIYRAERVDSLIIDAPGDADGDGYADFVDNCPDHPNIDQLDSNADGFGDTCTDALGILLPEPNPHLLLLAGATALVLIGRKGASISSRS